MAVSATSTQEELDRAKRMLCDCINIRDHDSFDAFSKWEYHYLDTLVFYINENGYLTELQVEILNRLWEKI